MERRVTRSSVLGNKFVNKEDISTEKDSGERVRVLSKEVKAKVGFDFCKQSIDNTEKRVTRGTARTTKANNVLTEKLHKVVNSDERKPKGGGELCTSKRDVQIGEKRKKHQVGEDCAFIRGWTEEQELALRRAYFAAKPTPRFWKKVARMVPGKSADECFNRIHYDHITPPQPRTRSRANRKQTSPVSYSASKLLSPDEIKTKKLRALRKTRVAKKTVRKLLKKQRNDDQDYKADLFSVLEPSIKLSPPLDFQESTPFASPVPNRGSSILTRCLEISSSAHKKQLPKLSCLQRAAFVSPPVLKQIKNKALHEKYIDQLHCRDAKRKAESKRNAKCVREKDEKMMRSQLEVNLVKVAKNALVSDAQVAISKFPTLQSSTNCDIDDDDDIMSCNDEGEDDDELC